MGKAALDMVAEAADKYSKKPVSYDPDHDGDEHCPLCGSPNFDEDKAKKLSEGFFKATAQGKPDAKK